MEEAKKRSRMDFIKAQMKSPIEYEKERKKDEIAEDLLKDIDPGMTDNELIKSMIAGDDRTKLQKIVNQVNAEEMAKLDDPNYTGPIGFAGVVGNIGTDLTPQPVSATPLPKTDKGEVSEGLSSSAVVNAPVAGMSFKANVSNVGMIGSNSSAVIETGPGLKATKGPNGGVTLYEVDEADIGIAQLKKGPPKRSPKQPVALGKRKLDI
jgi:hypothetical protein